MVYLVNPQNALGDSFFVKCFYSATFEKYFGRYFPMFFRWTEPHVIATICLVFLLLLPLIFLIRPDDSYLKISRLYNLSRLSLMTFFHRITYIYLFFCPIAFLIEQHPPCNGESFDQNEFNSLYYFPSPRFASFCLTILYMVFLASTARSIWRFAITFFLIFATLVFIFSGDLSFSQAIFTFSLSYIVHFYAQRVPFGFLIVENVILPIFFVTLLVIDRDRYFESDENIGRLFTPLAIWIADFVLLGRYWCTRAGFVSVGRPLDIQWEADSKSSAYYSILSSEEEDVFSSNLSKDFIDTMIALVVYLIGLIARYYCGNAFNSSAGGLV